MTASEFEKKYPRNPGESVDEWFARIAAERVEEAEKRRLHDGFVHDGNQNYITGDVLDLTFKPTTDRRRIT